MNPNHGRLSAAGFIDVGIYGHPLGACSRVGNDALVWIPKNASGTLRTLFGEVQHSIFDFDVETYYVFLRDPIERWKSGLIEYICRHIDPKNHRGWILNNLSKIQFDEHTVPQARFLNFTGRINYFDISRNDWIEELIRTLNDKHEAVLPENHHLTLNMNSYKGDKYKVELRKVIDDLTSPALLEKVHHFYRADIELYGKIKNVN